MFLKNRENNTASASWKPTRPNRRRRRRAGPVGVEEADELLGRVLRPAADLLGVGYADRSDRPGQSRLVAVGYHNVDCCMCICYHGRIRLFSVRMLQRKNSSHIFLSTSFVPPFISPPCPIPHSRQFVPPFVFPPFSPAIFLPPFFFSRVDVPPFFSRPS